jgi:colanic acid biosynthesis glycosyl transferase WcaI
MTVYHTFMPPKGQNILWRLLAWVFFHIVSVIAALTIVPRPAVVIAPSPPLTIGLCTWLLGMLYRAPYIYNVQEIYPDIAIRLGAVSNRWIIDLLYRLEKFVYSKASAVTVIASRMREQLLKKGVSDDKVHVIPNFVDVDDLAPLPKDNDFSRKHSLYNKFVVSYAGNMGPAQGLEYFIDAAKILRGEAGICFLMMGDGIHRESLRLRIVRYNLGNFVFLPYQRYSLMGQAYAASDLCLVPQAIETGFEAVPSKVYRIMACARPVLAVTDQNSDLACLVSEASCGAFVLPGSAEVLAEMIRQAYQNQQVWKEMGIDGREHVVRYYARETVTNQYHKLIETLISKSGR